MSINLKNSSTVTGDTLMTGRQNSTGATLHVKQNSSLSDSFALLVQTKNGGGDYSSSSGFYASDGDAMELRLANGGSNKVLISSDASTGSYLKGGATTFGRSITVGSDATASITLQASGTTFLQMFQSSSTSFINTGTSGGTVYFGAPASNVTNVNVQGTGTFQTISNATSDTDKFLVSDGGTVKYRTGAQVLSDIGGAPATGGAYLPLAGGTLTGGLIGTTVKYNTQISSNSLTGQKAFIGISSSSGAEKFKIYKNTNTTDGYARFKIDRAFDYGNNDQMVQEAIFQRRGSTKNFVFRYDGDIATLDDVYLEVYELSDGQVEIWLCVDDFAQPVVEVISNPSTSEIFTTPSAGTPTGTLIHSSNPDTETPNWNSHQGAGSFSGNIEAAAGNSGQITLSANSIASSNNIILSTPTGANIELYNSGSAYYDAVSHNFRDSDASPTYFNITASEVNSFVPLHMNDQKIYDLATPTAGADAATKAYVDSHGGGLGPFLPLAGGTMTGSIDLEDNVKAQFGNSSDLRIFHSSMGTGSFIEESGPGSLEIYSDTGVNIKSGALGENYAKFTLDGPIELYYDNSKKFETTNTGIGIIGDIDLTSSSSDILMIDNGGAALEIKQGSDLYMRFITTNGGEHIEVNKNMEIQGLTATAATFSSTVTVSNGQIVLDGTGRIQGVDTVSDSTDAANKAYVDASIPSLTNYVTLDTTQTISGAKTFSSDVKISGDTKDLIIENTAETKAGLVFIDAQDPTNQAAAIKFDCSAETLDFFMNDESAERMSITTSGRLIITSGDLFLQGTGRIQGVDTVTDSTDAANKLYVDNAISGVPQGTVTGTGTSGQIAIFNGSSSITSNSGLEEVSTGVLLVNSQVQVKGANAADFTCSADTDTGLGSFDTANGVSLVSKGKKQITVKEGKIAFDPYTAIAVSTTGPLSPNQDNQATTQDTLAALCVDPDGNVVRGEQEATFTFTLAQLNSTLGQTLISAPGADKAVVITYTDWMMKYSSTGSTSNNLEIRQANLAQASASVSILPALRFNEIVNQSQSGSAPFYGFYTRDIPTGSGSQGRTYAVNKATTIHKQNSGAYPSGLTSISIKIRYRIFDVDTF